MDQRLGEKILCILYVLSIICAGISSITSGVVWGYWRWTLDQCPGRNCSCILYGESTPTHFLGGSIYTCIYISFGPILIILTFIGLAIYHGVRSCFGPRTEATRSVMTKNESGEMIHMQIRTPEIKSVSRIYWIIASTLSVFCAVYMLAHFSTFADGYLHSCNQYRREIIKVLGQSGSAVAVIHNRLSCNAVFDFMDYLQPMVGNIVRDNFINTAVALIIGLLASFTTLLSLIGASVINIKFVRN